MSSTYRIDFNDATSNPGNNPVVVDRNTRDTTSVDLTLFGRGTFNYGEELNENLVHLLEHFASAEAERVVGSTIIQRREAVANIAPNTSNWAIRQPTVGQLWANKTTSHLHVFAQNIRKWDALAATGDVTANWGVIADGETIPLPISPTGYEYTEDECVWIVSPTELTLAINAAEFSADNRVVTATARYEDSDTPITANYMIIGIRDNVNAGSASADEGGFSQTLTVSISPLAVVGNIDESVAGTVEVTTVDASGNVLTPSGLTYTWYRVNESGDPICSGVSYDDPVRQDPSNAIFTFVASSQFPGACNPSWRVVVTDGTGREGESNTQMVFVFQTPQDVLTVSPVALSSAAAEANEIATAEVSATISGGTAPYTIEWSEEAIDGSGALLVTQTPPVTPPFTPTGDTTTTTASYSLQRATAQTVFTRVSVIVTDSESRQARGFTTIRYNFIESDTSIITPEIEPLTLVVDGTTEGVYTIENSAYIEPVAGDDGRVFTLSIPVSVIGTSQGNQIAITRLRDTDRVQFNLISPSIIFNATSGTFVFSITASTAAYYPGTNSDAWRITFTATDGRTVSRDVITKFNYLTNQRPLAVTVGDVTVTAVAQDQAIPDLTYVTLAASVQGGQAPYSYVWNTSAISTTAPFVIVGPTDRSTLTLALRGTTYNRDKQGEIVWPAPSVGDTDWVYSVPVSVTVRDSSLPSQEITATATAGIKFNVDDTTMSVAAAYSFTTADLTYSANDPYTMKGCWLCNESYVNASAPQQYNTFSRVTLNIKGGSGAYGLQWVEETVAAGSTLTGVIVFPDTTNYGKNVYFRSSETNCTAGNRYYEATWRCDVTDLHTGKVIEHVEVVRLDACRAAPGSVDQQIQKVPCGSGFTCG